MARTREKARQILSDARALLAERVRWYRGSYSDITEDQDFAWLHEGHQDKWNHPEAKAWCSLGAIYRVAGERSGLADDLGRSTLLARNILGAAIVPRPGLDLHRFGRRPLLTIGAWNDDLATTHEEVLATFDRAIASLSGKEAR